MAIMHTSEETFLATYVNLGGDNPCYSGNLAAYMRD